MSFKKFLPEPPSVLQHARSARYPLPAKSSCRQELLSACCLTVPGCLTTDMRKKRAHK